LIVILLGFILTIGGSARDRENIGDENVGNVGAAADGTLLDEKKKKKNGKREKRTRRKRNERGGKERRRSYLNESSN
jgi:hypothetical protein